MSGKSVDLVVIGGGIVGLATARQWLQSHPGESVVLVEAEGRLAAHQTGHNSGVIHSGIYYKPGSEKAVLCQRGKRQLEQFCDRYQVPTEKCGKVIVATDENELEVLNNICLRGQQNEVVHERITTSALHRIEPEVAGVAAIHVPGTGIVDYQAVCLALREQFESLGGVIHLGFHVTRINHLDDHIRLQGANRPTGDSWMISARSVVSCGGLHSDHLYRKSIADTDGVDEASRLKDRFQIVPFRGEYYQLKPDRRSLCRSLIYPVPDPAFPFLGVHFTRMIDGGVECGPNAVLAFGRHGYRWRDWDLRDLFETVRFKGFRSLARQHWAMGIQEMYRSVSRRAFARALQKLVPAVRCEYLVPHRAGVRAQAVNREGKLVDDFLIDHTPRMTHVLNAPSPAATASLAIAERVCQRHEAIAD